MTAISMGIGGNESFIVNTLKSIDASKFDIDIYCYDGTRMEHEREVLSLGSKIYISKVNQNSRLKYIYEVFEMNKFLKDKHYDIVHCNACSFLGLLKGTLGAKLYRKSMIISHSHSVGEPTGTTIDNFLRTGLRKILQWSVNYGLACSDYAGESKYTKNFRNSDRYMIVHNAIDTSQFLFNEKFRKDIKKRYNIFNKFVIGTVGRLSPPKNHSGLLDIYYELQKIQENTCLMIVGGGELDRKLKEKAESLGIADNVIFVGSTSEVNRYYSAMDVFVMTSKFEGLPFTVIEAQVNGLKCVMSDAITKMADVTGDNIFLSLHDKPEIWAKEIIEKGKKRSSKEKINKVIKDYELKNEIKRLERLYSGNGIS